MPVDRATDGLGMPPTPEPTEPGDTPLAPKVTFSADNGAGAGAGAGTGAGAVTGSGALHAGAGAVTGSGASFANRESENALNASARDMELELVVALDGCGAGAGTGAGAGAGAWAEVSFPEAPTDPCPWANAGARCPSCPSLEISRSTPGSTLGTGMPFLAS